jgi:hypothetical protein
MLASPCALPPCVFAWSSQNFCPGRTTVTIGGSAGGQPCTGVEITDGVGLGSLTCLAPAGPGIGANVQLVVAVQGSGTGSHNFVYAAPNVTRVAPSPCNAEVSCQVYIYGTDLGLKNTQTSPDPVIFVGKC